MKRREFLKSIPAMIAVVAGIPMLSKFENTTLSSGSTTVPETTEIDHIDDMTTFFEDKQSDRFYGDLFIADDGNLYIGGEFTKPYSYTVLQNRPSWYYFY